MEFQDYAATETSALCARLLAGQAGATLQQLQALRDAIDATARALEAAPQPEEQVDELVARLTAAAYEEARRAGDESRRISQEARRAIDEAEATLQTQVEENARLVAAVASADAERALLKSELQTALERAESAERDFVATVEAHGELETALKAADAQTRQLAQAKAHLENELGVTRAALEQTIGDVDQLRQELGLHHAERVELEQRLAAAQQVAAVERDALAGELERNRVELAAIQQLLTAAGETALERDALAREMEAAGDRARLQHSELESASDRIAALEAEVSAANGRSWGFETELEALRGRALNLEVDLAAAITAAERHNGVVTDLEVSRARTFTLEAERAEREEAMRQLQIRLDDALQAETRLREQAEAKLRENAARASDAGDSEQGEALRWEIERMVSLFDASVRAVNEMASARSSADLMTELLKRLSLQFSRVALFRVKGQALEGEQQVGFEDTDISKLVLPVTVDSLLTRAVTSGAVESLSGSDIARRLGTPFNGAPTSAVALPIMVQGSSVAVVYADDADMPESARGPAVHESSVAFAKLLVGEAALLLMVHTHELKTLAELRQYANTLLQEAKKMYLADAEAGKPAAQLRGRLKDNLECASQLYTYRAAMEGTAAAALLDEQIAAETSGTSQFARDLAEVVRSLANTELGITAEAS
jgi:hypothetical protein